MIRTRTAVTRHILEKVFFNEPEFFEQKMDTPADPLSPSLLGTRSDLTLPSWLKPVVQFLRAHSPASVAPSEMDDAQFDAVDRTKREFGLLLDELCKELVHDAEALRVHWDGPKDEGGYVQTMVSTTTHRFHKGDVYYCTCPEFVNLFLPSACRTCCHLSTINGVAQEQARVLTTIKRMHQRSYTFSLIGAAHKVDGSSDVYTLKLNPPPAKPKFDYNGPWWGCTCPSWRFGNFFSKREQFKLLGRHPAMRTCTHLTTLIGEREEIARVEEAYHCITAQGWVPPEERLDAKLWHCSCPAYAGSKMDRPSCKHIKAVGDRTACVLHHEKKQSDDRNDPVEVWRVQGSLMADGTTHNVYSVSYCLPNLADVEGAAAVPSKKRPNEDASDGQTGKSARPMPREEA